MTGTLISGSFNCSLVDIPWVKVAIQIKGFSLSNSVAGPELAGKCTASLIIDGPLDRSAVEWL